jgi:hypothetical protein
MAEIESKQVSLESLADGDAIALFQQELRKALENIADPNTPWKGARRVQLTVTISPNEARDYAVVEVDCVSKLSKAKGVETHFFMGTEGGKVVAYEQKVKQPELGLEPKVRNIQEGRK